MVVGQHQLRHEAAFQYRLHLGAVAGHGDIALPAAEQALHAGKDGRLVVDAQYLGAAEHGHAGRAGAARVAVVARHRHGDAEHAALARPGTYRQLVTQHPTQTIGDGQPEAQPLSAWVRWLSRRWNSSKMVCSLSRGIPGP